MNEVTETQKELLATIDRASKSSKRYASKIKELRLQVGKEGCEHPVTRPYRWEHDSGYGSQKWIDSEQCTLCLKKRPWPTMSVWYDA